MHCYLFNFIDNALHVHIKKIHVRFFFVELNNFWTLNKESMDIRHHQVLKRIIS